MADTPAKPKPTDPPYRVMAHEVFMRLPGARVVYGNTEVVDPTGSVWTVKRVAGTSEKLTADVMWDELSYRLVLHECLCCTKNVITGWYSKQPEAVANNKREPNLVVAFPIDIRRVLCAVIWNLAKEGGLVE